MSRLEPQRQPFPPIIGFPRSTSHIPRGPSSTPAPFRSPKNPGMLLGSARMVGMQRDDDVEGPMKLPTPAIYFAAWSAVRVGGYSAGRQTGAILDGPPPCLGLRVFSLCPCVRAVVALGVILRNLHP